MFLFVGEGGGAYLNCCLAESLSRFFWYGGCCCWSSVRSHNLPQSSVSNGHAASPHTVNPPVRLQPNKRGKVVTRRGLFHRPTRKEASEEGRN